MYSLLRHGARALPGALRATRGSVSQSMLNPKTSFQSTISQRYSSSKANYFDVEVRDEIAIIRMDEPGSPVNTISLKMTDEFGRVMDQIENDDKIKAAILISKKPNCFVAGADITMIDHVTTVEEGRAMSENGQQAMARIQNSKKPYLAAINGPALGGGLELAMACHYRIATTSSKTQLGLPEVMLGVLPGAGGTQRLVELVGPSKAFPMMLTGASKNAKTAKKMGLVDLTVEPIGPGIVDQVTAFEKVAFETAKGLASGAIKHKNKKLNTQDKVVTKALSFEPTRKYFFDTQVRAGIMKQTQGVYPAPLMIADVLEGSAKAGFGTEAAFKLEAAGFGQLTMKPQTASMIGLFNGRTHCGKNHWGKPEKPVKEIGILGAGLMGAGIAQVSINKGYKVVLKDSQQSFLDKGFNAVDAGYQKKVKKRKLSQWDYEKTMMNLVPTLNYQKLKDCDLVIEAVPEILDLKHRIIKEVQNVVRDDCIFASNTSGLLISEIAKAHTRPEKVIGMHYFSPVPQMQLLEIIVTDQTDKETIRAATQVGLKQGKLLIVAKDVAGFYCNRCLGPMIYEGIRLMQEQVDPNKLNKIAKKNGFPVGMMTLMDEVGIDVALHLAHNVHEAYGERVSAGGNPDVLQELVDAGFCGRKTGKGIFDYADPKAKTRDVTPTALNTFKKHSLSTSHGFTSDADIVNRLILRYTNEAALCLEEGVIATPAEGDVAAVFGTGYPACLGGPFKHIDRQGAGKIVNQLETYAAKLGPQFAPCDSLLQMAKNGDKFYK